VPRLRVEYALEHVDVEVPDGQLLVAPRSSSPRALPDVSAVVQQVLEEPLEFPPLCRALTPDDHVVVVVAETLSHLPELLGAVLEHLLGAGVLLERVTVLCPPRPDGTATFAWRDVLPETIRQVPVEIHQPADRGKLSYLATTKAGRRIYLNRTLVDADQLVVIGRIDYDPVLGYHGGLGDIFPALSDEATRAEFAQRVSHTVPGTRIWPAQQEAEEVGWLLGMPFLLQAIEGRGDDLCQVLGGAAAAVTKAGISLLEQQWRLTIGRSVSLVVATLTGEPTRQSIADVTRAFSAATRVVRPGGRIAVLSRAQGAIGPSLELARQTDDLAGALALARQQKLFDSARLWELALAAQHAQLCLLSSFPRELVEELSLTPLDRASQLQNLINQADSTLYLPDAHRTLALVSA
jgi:nickel-dependent lactate racemase